MLPWAARNVLLNTGVLTSMSLLQSHGCMSSSSAFPPLNPPKFLWLLLMLAERNSEDKETAVLTDCRQKCVNLGKFLKKKKVTALVHPSHPLLGSRKGLMQTPETGHAAVAVWLGDRVPENKGALGDRKGEMMKGEWREGGGRAGGRE